jgi:hypothetical protein
VIVTVIAVRMMQPAVDQIVHMIAVRDSFMSAVWSMLMCAADVRRTPLGILGTDGYGMFVDVVLMHVVEVPIMEVVHVAIVQDRGVSAVRPMLVGMVEMMFFGASHDCFSVGDPSLRSTPRRSIYGIAE